MLRYALSAALGAALAFGGVQAAHHVQAQTLQGPAGVSASAAALIRKGADGHYWAQADLNGQSLRLLVDTGASAVSLTRQDARLLGVDVDSLAYDHEVLTADGRVRAAKVSLASVGVAGAVVHDVDALVMENGLGASLLGMSYLSRLSKIEATPQSLTLRL